MTGRLIPRLTLFFALFLLLAGLNPAVSPTHAQTPPNFVPGEILVKFKPGTPGDAIAAAHRQNGGQVKHVIRGIDVQVVEVSVGQEIGRAAAYQRNPNVQFAEVNGFYHAIEHPTNDPRVGDQWQYNNTGQTGGTTDADMDAFEAWHVTPGSNRVAIAILDTGVDQSHQDLTSKLAKNINFTDSGTVDDLYGHGTHVAGSAAAASNNGVGVAGTCLNCVLYNVKVLNDQGSGAWSWIADGITWSANNGAQVVNLSLGAPSDSITVEAAIDYAWRNGVIIVAAAGNDGVATPFYPAHYTNAIAVAATDHSDAKASFSNYGDWVDVAAPGVNILSTAPDHRNTIWFWGVVYGTISGTSMASPHVAGLAGLVWSATGLCGAADNTCVRSRIESQADQISGTGSYWRHGRINASNSIGSSSSSPDTAPPAAPTGLAATAGDGQVSLDWADNAEMDLAGYDVYRSTTAGSSYSKVNSSLLTGSAYADTGLTNGTTYHYVVRAVDTATNESASSNEASATPSAGTTMHVGDLDATSTKLRQGQWQATVTITIHSGAEGPVDGAIVSGTFTQGSWSKGISCTTTASGVCTVDSGTFPSNDGKASFRVDNVTYTGRSYNPSANHDPDGDSNGTTIALSK